MRQGCVKADAATVLQNKDLDCVKRSNWISPSLVPAAGADVADNACGSVQFPGQHGLGNPPHGHQLQHHPFDSGSVSRSPRLGRVKPLPFDPTPILKAAEMQPWERALLEDYARLKQRRLAARLAAEQAQVGVDRGLAF